MKKSRILAGIWMLFLVLAYLVSASITIGIAAVATVLLCFFCFFLSIAMFLEILLYINFLCIVRRAPRLRKSRKAHTNIITLFERKVKTHNDKYCEQSRKLFSNMTVMLLLLSI